MSKMRQKTVVHTAKRRSQTDKTRINLISLRRKADQLEQSLKPKQTFDGIVEKAKLIMPQTVNDKAWSGQGRINMTEMMKLLKISQGTAYRLRRDVLKEYHAQDASRAEQHGSTKAERSTFDTDA
jgi:hypothetical protein